MHDFNIKIDDIINEYSNTYHTTTKKSLFMSCLVTALNTMLVLMTLEYTEFWNKIKKIISKEPCFYGLYLF